VRGHNNIVLVAGNNRGTATSSLQRRCLTSTFPSLCPAAAGDVAWAPYSSTCFAAVTDAGKVQVWDLSRDAHGPLCDQKIVKKARGTRLAFNTAAPVVLAADSLGGVVSLKLSPNLRRVTPIPQPQLKKVRPGVCGRCGWRDGGAGEGEVACVHEEKDASSLGGGHTAAR
jgi:hypothetical protein